MLMIWCYVVVLRSCVCRFIKVSQEWGYHICYDDGMKSFSVLYDDGISWKMLDVGNLKLERSFLEKLQREINLPLKEIGLPS